MHDGTYPLDAVSVVISVRGRLDKIFWGHLYKLIQTFHMNEDAIRAIRNTLQEDMGQLMLEFGVWLRMHKVCVG